MTDTTGQPTWGLRLGSMFLDHFAMCFIIAGIGGLIVNLISPLFERTLSQDNFSIGEKFLGVGLMGLVIMVLMSFFFNKDIFYGRSIAKRILKLQIVDSNTGQIATPFQCFLRNITIIIWPIEVIITLFNPTRRLGDRIAKTKVVFYNLDQIKTKMDWKNFTLAIISGLLLLLLSWALSFLIQPLVGAS